MKRNPSGAQRAIMRPPSPTNTTYSGISNYKSDAYRGPSAPSPADPRAIAQTHFDELHRYLASYLVREPANSRSTARQKLTRLTRQQFQELSTDVYDELVRRKTNTSENEIPFLPVRDDFHPKRNQARQKLATLPTGRFKDLSSDVYYELARRYPEFKDEAPDIAALVSSGSNYEDSPAPTRSGRQSQDTDFNGLPSARKPSEDFSIGRRSEIDPYGSNDPYSPAPSSSTVGTRRRPSEDRRKPSQDAIMGRRRPSESQSVTSDSTSSATNAQSATTGMIIPNKSTIAEEEIEVPYGREVRDSSGTAIDDREQRPRGNGAFRDQSGERSRGTDTEGDDDFRSPVGGLAGLSARLQANSNDVDDDDDGGRSSAAGGRSGDDYYDKMSYGRTSVTSDRSGGRGGGRASASGDDHQKIRRDYEYKIATMQTKIAGLERELEEAASRDSDRAHTEDRVRMLEEELDEVRRRAEEKTAGMRALQTELDQLRESHSRDRDAAARRAREDEEELQILRERCERLEVQGGGGNHDPDLLEQLRSDMEGLMSELGDLSRRNDELMAAKDADHVVIREMDAQLKEYKRKYEQAKTELRSMKATSQLFLPTPKTDDQWPVSSEGGLLDIHVTAFLSAVDGLLTAGRSNAPTRVLTPMKAVVNTVTYIVEDVRAYERRQRDRGEVDVDSLRVLRERAEATLSNLVAAAKTHATSSGMSPVSLLDAAASHVSSTITEIAKTVHVRKATKAEEEQFERPSSSSASASASSNSLNMSTSSLNGYGSSLLRNGTGSSSSGSLPPKRTGTMDSPMHSMSPPRSMLGRRPPSNPSSSERSANSPPPIFDLPPSTHTTGHTSEDHPGGEGQEDPWLELKPYLEAQTESIVYAIQSVLSGVRGPTPSPTLNENITQIITIVSSIVAVCKDSLPPVSAAQGEDILRVLSEHANKLSEVQSLPEVTKESRQIMAKSSYAIANAMKELMKL
ncbi:hypothetical protein BXZ70DRAFT_540058 [Cristinia sonorae]|uniref:GIT Spa2 homology (SHD) domain-containing protein n=1 Tax=Cristinia sonorae TaxID=1940300 RepID=A0A8K0UGA9_9AGAR|nr:hypothetical protein BXZ70DRAFT_540058 [Cristinia sonorae]